MKINPAINYLLALTAVTFSGCSLTRNLKHDQKMEDLAEHFVLSKRDSTGKIDFYIPKSNNDVAVTTQYLMHPKHDRHPQLVRRFYVNTKLGYIGAETLEEKKLNKIGYLKPFSKRDDLTSPFVKAMFEQAINKVEEEKAKTAALKNNKN